MKRRLYRRRHQRSIRDNIRRAAITIGLILLLAAIALPLIDAFNRAGLIERAFGWRALRDFSSRAATSLMNDRRLLFAAIAGIVLIIIGLRVRR